MWQLRSCARRFGTIYIQRKLGGMWKHCKTSDKLFTMIHVLVASFVSNMANTIALFNDPVTPIGADGR